MSKSNASAKNRRAFGGNPPPIPAQTNSMVSGPNYSQSTTNSQGFTLPQVISVIDSRLLHLEKFMKDSKDSTENTETTETIPINNFDKTNFHPDNPSNQTKDEIIDEFCSYLKEQIIEDKIAYVYAISFHFEVIKEEHKEYMKSVLEPSTSCKMNIITAMKNMKLAFKNYIVIHIRSGDSMLFYNEHVKNDFLKNILIEIYKIYKPQYNYLLLSDSVNLKHKIVSVFPKIKTSFKEITHFGEGQELEDEKIKNTLLDFYLMAYSGRIYSYSCYEHGSGFSRWCAETYNIPYKCAVIT